MKILHAAIFQVLWICSSDGGVARWADASNPVTEGLVVWFDATRENEAREAHYMNRLAAGDPAELWHDSSGNGRHLVQWSHAARPKWEPTALEFDGDDYLAALFTPPVSVKAATIVITAAVPAPAGDFPALISVARRGENDYTSGICADFGRHPSAPGVIDGLNVEGAGQTGEANMIKSPVEASRGHVFSISVSQSATKVRIDGAAQGGRERGNAALAVDRLAAGARFVEPAMRHFLKGQIAEILIFDKELDGATLTLLEGYLAKKHAEFLSHPERSRRESARNSGRGVQMLVPGFEVRELPVSVTNLNNIEYAADGRLFAGGYDGRFHLFRDRDNDGLEEEVITFSAQTTDDYPLGMAVKDGMPHAVLSDEIIRFRDTNGDGVPDQRETVAKGWDDAALRQSPLLMHRRVDSAMALAAGQDDDWYVTMGSANPGNGYWQHAEGDPFATDTTKTGKASYTTDKRRGCLLRIDRNGKVTQLNSGLRYIMSLQWDRHGSLFGTDQEGATWLPNGNPYDELLHLQEGRHYGFPPRHPGLLPDVTDEPSVWDYAPQHQSACGFRFNGPSASRGRFGPEFWAHDAIVTGESRGKLWRTKLARTAAGYVATNQVIACLGMLVTDCAVSPTGELVICCHSGEPDWGSGPNGQGKLFKIRPAGKKVPMPAFAWAESETESVIAFDEPLAADWTGQANFRMEAGRYVEAGDRYESMRPGYAVVQSQQKEPRAPLEVTGVRLNEDRRRITVVTKARSTAVNYAVSCGRTEEGFDIGHDLSGVACEWTSNARPPEIVRTWLPHPDFTAAREFTAASALHDVLWSRTASAGTLTMRGQMDLWRMLIPRTQPGSKLDYTPEAEEVTITFVSDGAVSLYAPGAQIEQAAKGAVKLTILTSQENKWLPFTLTVTTPAKTLDVSFTTKRDARPRALPVRRFLVPFAKPPAPDEEPKPPQEIAGGNWKAGRELYSGKATCATCHKLRGEGQRVGPDLDNLIHRDYASVLADIANPNAAINPDAVSYLVTLHDNTTAVGTRILDTPEELHLAMPGGAVTKIRKADIAKSEPLAVSLMPPGLDKSLTTTELRDLMHYLLLEGPRPETEKQ